MTPGIYNIPGITRGDTFAARTIATAIDDGSPLVITSARLHIRTKRDGTLVHKWETASGGASIVGTNAVLIDEVLPAVTSTWPNGVHSYDLEVVTATYGTITLLAGDFPIRADVTRD